MTAAAFVKKRLEKKQPITDESIDGAMAGNLCRCATYTRIRAGIKRAAGMTTAGKEAAQ